MTKVCMILNLIKGLHITMFVHQGHTIGQGFTINILVTEFDILNQMPTILMKDRFLSTEIHNLTIFTEIQVLVLTMEIMGMEITSMVFVEIVEDTGLRTLPHFHIRMEEIIIIKNKLTSYNIFSQ